MFTLAILLELIAQRTLANLISEFLVDPAQFEG